MKKKYSLILDDEFINYCKINNINDIETTAKKVFKRGFDILKYGEVPLIFKEKKVTNIKEEQTTVKNNKINKSDNLYSE